MSLPEAFSGTMLFFSAFSFLAVVFAVLVVTLKNPVSSAFSLVMVLFNVAAIFALQGAHFAAAVQVLVYAGAIAVLFVFVVMLLNIEEVALDFPIAKSGYFVAAAASVAFFVLTVLVISRGGTSFEIGAQTPEAIAQSGGNLRVVSETMFAKYVYSFEVVAMLLTLAIVGAVVLAKRRVD